MAIADPLTVDMGSDPDLVLNRTGFTESGGIFQTLDGLTKLSVSHSSKRRVRHEIRLDDKRSIEDPLVPTINRDVTASVYLVVNAPTTGYTNEELVELTGKLLAVVSTGAPSVGEQVIGGQS